MTSPVTEKAIKKNVWQMPESSKYLQEILVLDNGHLLDQVLKRSGILQRIVNKELGITSRKKCCWNSQKVDVQFSVQQLHCPSVRSKSKRHAKLSIHFTANQETIETIFRIIVFLQISSVRAVAKLFEECESLHDRSGQPDMVIGQSIVLSEIRTEVPKENDDPSYPISLVQRYEERIRKLSKEDKVNFQWMQDM